MDIIIIIIIMGIYYAHIHLKKALKAQLQENYYK